MDFPKLKLCDHGFAPGRCETCGPYLLIPPAELWAQLKKAEAELSRRRGAIVRLLAECASLERRAEAAEAELAESETE